MLHELKILTKLLIGVFVTTIFCFYLIYYLVALQCHWPSLKTDTTDNDKILRALIFSDTHLLGPSQSRWIINYEKEGHMYQSFQAILRVHTPDVIFGLGNFIDHGSVKSDEEYAHEIKRFFEIFPNSSNMYLVPGNHDIGHHDWMHPTAHKRFNQLMNASDVRHLYIKGSNIILLNSIALYGDACKMCTTARKQINDISEKLNYHLNLTECRDKQNCTRPIIMQHLPLYRDSDEICQGPDVSPYPIKARRYVPNSNTLSKEASDYLVSKLKPRAVFGAHNHYACLRNHTFKKGHETFEFIEVSVSAFNWVFRREPKYLLISITPDELAGRVCDLPTEFTIVILAVSLLFLTLIFSFFYEIRVFISSLFKKKTSV